eukprot:1187195-Prorocentrum_minimum.AAC.1
MSAGHGELLETYASTLPPRTIIAVTDVFDVVFTGDVPKLATFLSGWLEKRPGTIIWSYGRGCYPVPGWQHGACRHSPAYGLNAGFYAGFASDVTLLSRKFQVENKRILRKKLPPTGGDQAVWIQMASRNLRPLFYRMDTQQEIVRFPVSLDGKPLTLPEFVSQEFTQPIVHCSGRNKDPCAVLYETRYKNMTQQHISILSSSTIMTGRGFQATPGKSQKWSPTNSACRHIKILEDRRKLKRPDIVVIPRLKEAAVIPETFQFRRGKERLSNIQGRAQPKRKKYENTLALLVEQGWAPVLIFGTLGEITVDTGEALSENTGVRGLSLAKLLTLVHK